MNVGACMKREVITIDLSATLREAAALFVAHHVGMLPVVDKDRRPVGVLRLQDLLGLVLPDFLELIQDFDFVHDFGVAESQQPSAELLSRSVKDAMENTVSAPETCGLLRAFAILLRRDLNDLPIVGPDGRLVGLASRVDIATALLSQWRLPSKE